MEALSNSQIISKAKNIFPYIRWSYLEKLNPLKDKKILVVGLSKTGTTSLHDALEIVGVKSIHYPQPYRLVGRNLEFKWHWKLERIRAFSDLPVVAFLDDFLKKYPDSYIIYTNRNKGSWLESCRKHFELPAINAKGEALRLKVYGCAVFDLESFSKTYDMHSEMISKIFSGHPNFLEISVEQTDKWTPLCKFIGVPIPDVDYPFSNKRKK